VRAAGGRRPPPEHLGQAKVRVLIDAVKQVVMLGALSRRAQSAPPQVCCSSVSQPGLA
jgi:hypothetical protein